MYITDSTRKDKKYMAVFHDGTITHFGSKGYSDYTIHKDENRKDAYIRRHKKNENWNDYKSAGALSRWILWEYPDIKVALKKYKEKFNLK